MCHVWLIITKICIPWWCVYECFLLLLHQFHFFSIFLVELIPFARLFAWQLHSTSCVFQVTRLPVFWKHFLLFTSAFRSIIPMSIIYVLHAIFFFIMFLQKSFIKYEVVLLFDLVPITCVSRYEFHTLLILVWLETKKQDFSCSQHFSFLFIINKYLCFKLNKIKIHFRGACH